MKIKSRNICLSFILSFIIITLVFLLVGIIGGDFSMFEGDSYQQYIIFISDFISNIKHGNSNWYSFSNFLGSGNILTIAYYCLSPFNVLFFLFGENVFIAFYLVVVLKIAIASSCFYYFISEFADSDKTYYIVAAIFYSLSGYTVSWYFNIMWLDSLYILPLIIAFIVRYVRKSNYIVLVLLYSYLFITNFYMGYIVGIFSALFFVAYLLYYNQICLRGKILLYLKKGLGFFGIVILATGLSSALLLPVAGYMTEHMAGDNVAFKNMTINIFDIFNSMFIGEFQTMDNKVPVLYAGLPSMFLSILFFINKKVDIKEKIMWGGILAFYLFGMLLLPVYKFLHAFDYPNYYGYRFSFVVVFSIITISCIALEHIDLTDFSVIKVLSIGALFFYSFMMTFQRIIYAGNRLNDQEGLLVNFIFCVAWLVLVFYYLKRDKKTTKRFMFALFFLASMELTTNGYMCIKNTDFPHIEKALINEWYYAINEKAEEINLDDEFNRVYINNDINMNSGKMFGLNGLNTFSSADSYNLRLAVSKLGASTSNRYMRTNCNIPVFDSLFAVNYSIRLPEYQEYVKGSYDANNFITASLSKSEYPLSIGYMVSANILDYTLTNDSFDNMERLCQAMTGIEADFYKEFSFDDTDTMVQNYYTEEIDGRTYFTRKSDIYKGESGIAYVMSDYKDNRYVEFAYDNPGSYDVFPNVYTDEHGAYHGKLLAEGGIYKMGDLNGYSYIKIANTTNPAPNFYLEEVHAAEYNEQVFLPIYNELASNQFVVEINEGDYISGSVISTKDKPYLFTTIPYDPEWHIYVDGQPITTLYRVVGDAFMAVRLTPGEHTVTFEYIEKWSNEGMIITLISITVFCVLVLMTIFKKSGDDKTNKSTNVAKNEEVIGENK